MIIIALAIAGLSLWAGYIWGRGVGRTELERKIINHVVESPEYSYDIVGAIRKGLKEMR